MKAIVDKIDELIKANLALHVARTSPMAAAAGAHRNEFIARQEAAVARQKEELTKALQIIFGA